MIFLIIVAAMMQVYVVPNFPAHHMLLYGQGSLSAELSIAVN